MTRQVAFLRAVNLGATRRVPMAELRSHLSAEGFDGVSTYLASGNVLLTSELAPDELARELEARIAARFGLDVPVAVRTRDALAAIVASNPLAAVAVDPKRYQVSFLSAEADPALAARLDAVAVAPEAVAVRGREIFAWHPNGIIRSQLAKALGDRRLGATARNWNTVTALLALASGA